MKVKQIFGAMLAGLVLMIFAVGCSTEKSPTDIEVHPEGWKDVSSPLFHGKKVEAAHSIDNCMTCHGATLADGGKAGVACTDCHKSQKVEDPTKHPARVQKLEWDLSSCTYCHGENYTGTDVSANCTTSSCHAREAGPEACVTCHGNFSKTYSTGELTLEDIAPPADLEGETRPLSTGVGYHQYHLEHGVTCIGCHPRVTSFDDPDHISGDGIAQISDKFIRSWDHDTATCTSACHLVNGQPESRQWTIE